MRALRIATIAIAFVFLFWAAAGITFAFVHFGGALGIAALLSIIFGVVVGIAETR